MQLKKLLISYTLLQACYALTSYLILLRDDFMLERVAFLLQNPNLLVLGRQIAKTLHVNGFSLILMLILIPLLFINYRQILQIIKTGRQNKKNLKIIIYFSLFFSLLAFFSFPSLSTDVFDYIASNRVLFVHHANPWIEPPQNFPTDEFIYLGSWKFRASVYGPVQFVFSSLVQITAQDQLLLNIMGFKAISLTFFWLSALVIYMYLKRFQPQKLVAGLTFFLLNPLILIEIIGNAHNDLSMGFFTLLSLYFLFTSGYIFSAISLSLAFLSKVSSLIFFPLIFLYLLFWGRIKKAFIFLSVFIFFSLSGLLTLGKGLSFFIKNLGVQTALYHHSLPTVIRYIFLQLGTSGNRAFFLEKLITVPIFLVFFFFLLLRLKKDKLIETLILAGCFYLLLASPMLKPWYLAWFLPLVSLTDSEKYKRLLIAFSFGGLFYYCLLFTSYYFSPLHIIWQILMYLGIVLPPLISWFISSRLLEARKL